MRWHGHVMYTVERHHLESPRREISSWHPPSVSEAPCCLGNVYTGSIQYASTESWLNDTLYRYDFRHIPDRISSPIGVCTPLRLDEDRHSVHYLHSDTSNTPYSLSVGVCEHIASYRCHTDCIDLHAFRCCTDTESILHWGCRFNSHGLSSRFSSHGLSSSRTLKSTRVVFILQYLDWWVVHEG